MLGVNVDAYANLFDGSDSALIASSNLIWNRVIRLHASGIDHPLLERYLIALAQ